MSKRHPGNYIGFLALSLVLIFSVRWSSLVKNLSAMQETPVRFLGWEDPCRRDRLPTPVFLGFPAGPDGKESVCDVGDLGSIPGLVRIPWRRERLPTSVLRPGESHPSPWGNKEQDMAEPPLLSLRY